jgi:hypothetical protein
MSVTNIFILRLRMLLRKIPNCSHPLSSEGANKFEDRVAAQTGQPLRHSQTKQNLIKIQNKFKIIQSEYLHLNWEW